MRNLAPVSRIAAIAVLLAIIVLSLMPLSAPPGLPKWSDKVEHGLAYFALSFFFFLGFPKAASRPALSILCLSSIILLGLAIEVIQPRVGRDFDLLDLAADAVGAVLGWAAALAFRRQKSGKTEEAATAFERNAR